MAGADGAPASPEPDSSPADPAAPRRPGPRPAPEALGGSATNRARQIPSKANTKSDAERPIPARPAATLGAYIKSARAVADADRGAHRPNMLSLYRAWLGPSPCVSRPAPPPGAHRPVPRRARPPSPCPHPLPTPSAPASPASSDDSELDVERVEGPETTAGPSLRRAASGAVLDVASCDGPVRFSRVLNAAWRSHPPSPDEGTAAWGCRHRGKQPAQPQYYPCKTCGSKFPSYYFVHKHRKRCHVDEVDTPETSLRPPAKAAASEAPAADAAGPSPGSSRARPPAAAPDALRVGG
ncbi:hypothetical protein EVAR_31507_1 [Eumeta japonica]|uniref:C2H2-type domain-containing protein n=1 Tax=Eumeta variegata TaxID=151549 RepID=A0A4C1Z3I9_EUMVA|nr:hypothetical protein EVAR_31507_1 [Eumeta japonica]